MNDLRIRSIYFALLNKRTEITKLNRKTYLGNYFIYIIRFFLMISFRSTNLQKPIFFRFTLVHH